VLSTLDLFCIFFQNNFTEFRLDSRIHIRTLPPPTRHPTHKHTKPIILSHRFRRSLSFTNTHTHKRVLVARTQNNGSYINSKTTFVKRGQVSERTLTRMRIDVLLDLDIQNCVCFTLNGFYIPWIFVNKTDNIVLQQPKDYFLLFSTLHRLLRCYTYKKLGGGLTFSSKSCTVFFIFIFFFRFLCTTKQYRQLQLCQYYYLVVCSVCY